MSDAYTEVRELRVVVCLRDAGDIAAAHTAYATGKAASGRGQIRFATHAASLYELEQKVEEQDADVVLIDSASVPDDAARKHLATILTTLRNKPAKPVIAIGVAYKPEWKLTFEAAGAMGAVDGPLGALVMEQVTQVIAVGMQRALKDRQSELWNAQISPETARMMSGRGLHHHNVCVWAPKGGVGKDFLAWNLAYALGVMAGEPTLLIDCDMNTGDIGTYAQVDAAKASLFLLAHEWKARECRMDKGMVEKQILRVKGSLDVICGAHNMMMTGEPAFRDEVFAHALVSAATGLGHTFKIFNLGQNLFEPMHLVPLQRATINLVIATTELSTARELIGALEGLRKASPGEVTDDRYRLVLNKWTANPSLDARQLQKMTALSEFGRIPYGDYEKITEGLNKGKPAVLENDTVGNALLSLAASFHPGLVEILNKRKGVKPAGGLKRLFIRNGATAHA